MFAYIIIIYIEKKYYIYKGIANAQPSYKKHLKYTHTSNSIYIGNNIIKTLNITPILPMEISFT